MRLFLVCVFALLVFALPASAQYYDDRVCVDGCDRPGDSVEAASNGGLAPLYVDPEDAYLDEDQLRNRRQYLSYDDNDRRYRKRRKYRRHVRRGTRRRELRRKHRHLRHIRPTFRGRTKFCSDHVEVRRDESGRKVRVRNCVWVRNDLLHRYREGY